MTMLGNLPNPHAMKNAFDAYAFKSTLPTCKTIGCGNSVHTGEDFCPTCQRAQQQLGTKEQLDALNAPGISERVEDLDIPDGDQKPVTHLDVIDVYDVHQLFEVNDPSGCLQRASAKLLTSSQMPPRDRGYMIERARNLLNRWLEINGR